MANSIIPAKGVAERRARRARRASEIVVRTLLSRARHGTLCLSDSSSTRRYGRGGPEVQVTIRDTRTYHALLLGGSVGFGESYTDGWWDCDDLTMVVRFVIKNLSPLMRRLDAVARTFAPLSHLWQRLERVDKERDRANIRAHYDLGNDFYRADARRNDDVLLRVLRRSRPPRCTTPRSPSSRRSVESCALGPEDHVVEIGTGWGGFATHAAEHHGCRVTTVTISDAQFEYTRARVARGGPRAPASTVLQSGLPRPHGHVRQAGVDRDDRGDRLAPTRHVLLDVRRGCSSPAGSWVCRPSRINDLSYERAKNREDFIKRMIFPGGFLPSLEAIIRSSPARERSARRGPRGHRAPLRRDARVAGETSSQAWGPRSGRWDSARSSTECGTCTCATARPPSSSATSATCNWCWRARVGLRPWGRAPRVDLDRRGRAPSPPPRTKCEDQQGSHAQRVEKVVVVEAVVGEDHHVSSR